jgi:hypothetical protein
MTEIKLDADKHDIRDLIRYLDGDHHMSVFDRQQVVNDLKAQLPESDMVEPPKDCVVMDVMARSWLYDDDSEMWLNEGMPESQLSWPDLLGLYADPPRVYYPEVPRGGEDLDAPWRAQQQLCNTILTRLRELHARAVLVERKHAYERAIKEVEELKP